MRKLLFSFSFVFAITALIGNAIFSSCVDQNKLKEELKAEMEQERQLEDLQKENEKLKAELESKPKDSAVETENMAQQEKKEPHDVAIKESTEIVKKPVHKQNVTKMAGSIGPYPITLFLDYDTCEGYYYYNDRPKAIFRLDCITQETVLCNAAGRITKRILLKEYYTKTGKNTGIFDGTLEMAAGRGELLIGTFTNTTNGNKFEFYIENGHFAIQ